MSDDHRSLGIYLVILFGLVTVFILFSLGVSASPFAPSNPRNVDHPNRMDFISDPSRSDLFDREFYADAIGVLPCVDLDEYNAYADADPFDRFTRDDIKNDVSRLSYSDFNRVAVSNPFDNIDSNLFDPNRDFYCSSQNEYLDFAGSNIGDSFNGYNQPRFWNRDANLIIIGDEIIEDIMNDPSASEDWAYLQSFAFNDY